MDSARREIDDREQVALGHAARQPARAERADDVEQADQRDGPGADVGAEPAVDQIGRQMHGDEGELEAAGEEAEHQQHVAAVTERLAQRLLGRLRLGRAGDRRRSAASPAPATAAAPAASSRRTPAARSARRMRRSANAPAANRGTGRTSPTPCRRRTRTARQFSGTSLPSAPITIGNEQPARPKPIITPAERSSVAIEFACAITGEPGGVEDRAGAQHAHRAEAVGDGAGEWLRRAPEQVLDGDGEREGFAAPAVLERHRRQELADRRTRPEGDQRDGAADRDQHRRGPPGRKPHRRRRGRRRS